MKKIPFALLVLFFSNEEKSAFLINIKLFYLLICDSTKRKPRINAQIGEGARRNIRPNFLSGVKLNFFESEELVEEELQKTS